MKGCFERIEKERAKSRGEEMFPELVEQKGDIPVIKDQLPTIFHHKGIPPRTIHRNFVDAMDQAMAAFSTTCADQNEMDHAALARAVRKGKVPAVSEEVQ